VVRVSIDAMETWERERKRLGKTRVESETGRVAIGFGIFYSSIKDADSDRSSSSDPTSSNFVTTGGHGCVSYHPKI
jgi:hypothetical protein